jgi:hypothetical protein
MDDVTKFLVIYIVPSLVLGVGGFMIKSVLSRLDVVEKVLAEKVEEVDVRRLLADKIEPLSQDIHELNEKLDKIYDYLIKK